jgi:hypothetical protein
MGDDDYDPNQDDDVASDHLDDEAPGPSKRTVTAAGGKKGDVSPLYLLDGEEILKIQAGRAAWEGAYKATWDMVQEDEEGGIQHSVDSFMARARRKRYVALYPNGESSWIGQ